MRCTGVYQLNIDRCICACRPFHVAPVPLLFNHFHLPAAHGRYLASCILSKTHLVSKNSIKSLERLELGTVPSSVRSATFHKFCLQNKNMPFSLGLCCGTQSFTRELGNTNNITLDNDARFAPTILMGICEWDYRRWFAERKMTTVDLVWASCPCTMYSNGM